jgi:hypothetical protein
MFCPKCNATVEPTERFCSKCGLALKDGFKSDTPHLEGGSQQRSTGAASTQTAPSNHKLRRVLIQSILLVVVLLIGAGSIWWYFHRTPPDSVWVEPPVYLFSPDAKLYGLVDLQGNVRVQPTVSLRARPFFPWGFEDDSLKA